MCRRASCDHGRMNGRMTSQGHEQGKRGQMLRTRGRGEPVGGGAPGRCVAPARRVGPGRCAAGRSGVLRAIEVAVLRRTNPKPRLEWAPGAHGCRPLSVTISSTTASSATAHSTPLCVPSINSSRSGWRPLARAPPFPSRSSLLRSMSRSRSRSLTSSDRWSDMIRRCRCG